MAQGSPISSPGTYGVTLESIDGEDKARRTEPEYTAINSPQSSHGEAVVPASEPLKSRRRGRKPRAAKEAPLLDRDANKQTPPLITPGSAHHSDLASFLAYASRVGLAPTTNVYVGTHYEYTVASSLRRLDLTLTRVGRTADLGIDLLGTWQVPGRPEPLRVLVQCKAETPRPTMVRELEGAVVGAPAGWRGQGVVALLAARHGATKGVREAVRRSSLPMGFANVTTSGLVRQFIWNAAAVERGLEGVGVTVKYSAGNVKEPEVVLTWDGRPWVAQDDKVKSPEDT
ncbi:hypothetical protein MBLNU459_g7971t1 [Dothideomycetes sp. NU459]